MYILLLGSFLVIGYLLGKVDTLNNQKTTVLASESTSAPIQTTQQQQPPAAPDPEEVLSKLKVGHLPAEGDPNAPVTIVEFSDFQCPYCAAFVKETLPKIRADYVETGKVKIYYRHLPLAFHPQAKPLAIASECANDQGKFWEMHDKIFENSATINDSSVADHKNWAAELGLDTITFNNCVDSQEHMDKVNEDLSAAGQVGATGTPTFYINGHQLVGALPYESFKALIDQQLQ